MVNKPNCIILDGFTGVGGNAIQFAKRGAFVYAIDMDPIKLRCAAQNARVYGVADRISFICGDFFHITKMMLDSRGRCGKLKKKNPPKINNLVAQDLIENWYRQSDSKDYNEPSASAENPYGIDAIFLSPPWGGPSYLKEKCFDLTLHVEPNGVDIFNMAKSISPNICYFLPRNTDVKQVLLFFC